MYPEEDERYIDDILANLKGLLKSKTLYGLTAVMPTILLALKGIGITLTPEITAGIYILGGIVYRVITKTALKDK